MKKAEQHREEGRNQCDQCFELLVSEIDDLIAQNAELDGINEALRNEVKGLKEELKERP